MVIRGLNLSYLNCIIFISSLVAAIDNPPKYDKGFDRLSVKDPTRFSKESFNKKLKTIFPSELWSSNDEELKKEIQAVYFPNYDAEAENSTFYVVKFGQV